MFRLSFLVSAACLVFSTTLGFAAAAPADEDLRQVTFDGFDLKDGRPLFKGERTIQVGEGKVQETVVYLDLNGRETQRLEGVYEQGTLGLVSYVRKFVGSQEREGLEREGGQFVMSYQDGKNAKPETEELTWKDGLVFAITVVPRIKQARKALKAGKEVTFDLIVPSRMNLYEFRLRQDKPVTINGQEMWVVRMEPDSFLIRQLIDPLYFYFTDNGSIDLVEYKGRTAVHDAAGNSLDARVVYRYGNPG